MPLPIKADPKYMPPTIWILHHIPIHIFMYKYRKARNNKTLPIHPKLKLPLSSSFFFFTVHTLPIHLYFILLLFSHQIKNSTYKSIYVVKIGNSPHMKHWSIYKDPKAINKDTKGLNIVVSKIHPKIMEIRNHITSNLHEW